MRRFDRTDDPADPPAGSDSAGGLTPGDRLGEYEIVREVGRGGMGVVYEARQPALARRVAVKVLPAAFAASPNLVRRFTVEAQAAAAVSHPNIVPVYAVGRHGGLHYFVMGLVDGFSLAELASPTAFAPTARVDGDTPSQPIPTDPAAGLHRLAALAVADRGLYHRAVAGIVARVARALDHAHRLGVIHRDVKPANLLLDRGGQVWVTDFGLAHVRDDRATSLTGGVIGTLQYISPEQLAGDRRWLDHRTDIYSLAATLYELLTGRPAVPATTTATVLDFIRRHDPVPPRRLDPAMARDLETVVLKALQKDPRDRYATAAAFADDLERFAEGRPVSARRPSLVDHGRKWLARHPGVALAGWVGGVAVAVVVTVAAVLLADGRAAVRRALVAERRRADEAERRFGQALRVSDLVVQISEEELGAGLPPLQGTRRRLLEAALESYDGLLASADDPRLADPARANAARVRRLLTDQTSTFRDDAVLLLAVPPLRPALAADLKLTAEQERAIDAAFGPGLGADPLLMPLTAPPETRAALDRVLTPDQRHRLWQVALRLLGPLAFDDAQVVAHLGLTRGQAEAVRARRNDLMGAAAGPPGGSDEWERVVAAVLRPDQLARWTELLGPPFQAPHLPMPPLSTRR